MKSVICNLNRKTCFLLLINLLLITAFLLVSSASGKAVKRMYSQQTAARWEEKKNSYAQVSAFFAPQSSIQEEDINNIRSSVMQTLSKDALTEAKGRVWIDAYSAEGKAEVRKDSNTLNVTAVGIGGDFFQFHPIPLLSGSYLSDGDLNYDRIIVDEGFAWAMFGSNDIVGMQVWMGESIYVIAGVVAVDRKDDLYNIAYGGENRIYMFYDKLKEQQESLAATCYEAALPNPITNYAYNTLRSACGLSDEEESATMGEENPLNFDNVEVIENTSRYKVLPMLSKIKTLKLRSMRTNSIVYPFWENIARVAEEKQLFLLAVKALLLVFPCICLIWWLCSLWKNRTWTAKDIVVKMIEKIREKRELEIAESSLEGAIPGQMEEEELSLEEKPEDGELYSVTTEDIFHE